MIAKAHIMERSSIANVPTIDIPSAIQKHADGRTVATATRSVQSSLPTNASVHADAPVAVRSIHSPKRCLYPFNVAEGGAIVEPQLLILLLLLIHRAGCSMLELAPLQRRHVAIAGTSVLSYFAG